MKFSEVRHDCVNGGTCTSEELIHLASAGYLYFHAAPDSKSFHQECVRRVKNLHTADCLRANK